ncbi:dihydrofolate reductase family protein [Paenibacillus sp. BSR1-1]|uniref:dihydrofolate reductase family protein n=1 Tax=Paenibacillus sp. BSR1-1 TaxID=3020845 RepID=UPI0025B055F3|nr:dihydrofolate reductase family protein [Paenibacillus sp. BSR1-1]MDN3015585.1 dihydrofolate reductase family protein [Paenibacillus sp. BSR1-1]
MGKLVVNMFMTLDGVIQAPGRLDEDREGDFGYGGWQAPYVDAEAGQLIAADYARLDALLLGRKTYEIFAPYWQQAPASSPFTKLLNEKPKYVASRTLTSVDWNNSKLLDADVTTSVPLLKERYAEVHVAGSSDLIQTLLRHQLIDRMNIWQFPVLLGKGKRFFDSGTIPTALQLLESRTFPSGSVLLRYEASGKPTFGNME